MADTIEIISCPACGSEMVKVFLPELNLNIDVCADGCGGIFFDNRELKILNNNVEQIDVLMESVEGKTFKKVDESLDRICPVCNVRMVKNKVNNDEVHDGEFVVIDECYTCGSKFLDLGELEKFKHKQAVKPEEKLGVDVPYLYSQVGLATDSVDKDLEKMSPLKKLFNKMFG